MKEFCRKCGAKIDWGSTIHTDPGTGGSPNTIWGTCKCYTYIYAGHSVDVKEPLPPPEPDLLETRPVYHKTPYP